MDALKTRSLGTRIFRYFKDPEVAWWRKLAGLAAVGYLVLPLDAIPDVIPVIGWLDDLGVLSLATWFVLREVRKHSDKQGGR